MRKILVMDSQLVFLPRIKCDYLEEILNAKIMKAQKC